MATVSPPSDWQIGKTLSECFDHILTSGIASDVTFLVGKKKKKMSSHKLVLISRSPVFYAMFEGPMAEKGGEIIIPDISEDTFRLFLRYLYTDTINLTEENVVAVFDAARKYCVDILVSRCEEFLTKHVTVDNACMFLEQTHVFVMDDLKTECLRVIDENPMKAMQSVTFTDLCLSCVTSITESDVLRVGEKDVYEAIIRWAEAECARKNLEATVQSKRDVLGATLYNVRYLHVDEEFLFGKICSDRILKPEDVVDIINHTRNQQPLVSDKLNTNKRIRIPQRIYRNGPVFQNQWTFHQENDGISFKSSTDMYLYGFGSFHTAYEPSSVNLKVFEANVCLVKSTKTLGASQPDTPHMGDVVFDQPIKIRARQTYTVVERSNRPKLYYFDKGQAIITHQHGTIEFSNSMKTTHTATPRGQIPYLLLSL